MTGAQRSDLDRLARQAAVAGDFAGANYHIGLSRPCW
jgi:hypothetical protein